MGERPIGVWRPQPLPPLAPPGRMIHGLLSVSEGGRTAPRGARKEGSQAAGLTGIRSAEAWRAPADMTRALGSARLGSARLGSARLGSARLGSARLGSARLGSARLGSARLGSARLGSARLGSALNYTFCRIVIYKRVQEHCLTTPWLPAGLPPRRSRAMHALPGRLDRSREAIGAGRGREERPGRGSPLGLRPLEAERPVVREPRREADRVGTLPVARRSGHVLDRLPRCESVEGAIRRARAQHSARAMTSHIRCIRPVTSASFENTTTSSF